MKIHVHLIESGLSLGSCVGNALVDMYVKCESLYDATTVFNRLPIRDVIAWTALLAGYAQQGFGEKALHLFDAMQQYGVNPTPITLVLILRACSSVAEGGKIHSLIIESGLELEEFAGSSLVESVGPTILPVCEGFASFRFGVFFLTFFLGFFCCISDVSYGGVLETIFVCLVEVVL